MIQEALDAASLDLKQCTAILSFVILSLDIYISTVNSEISDLIELHRPMYRGQKVYFAGKYNMESVCNGRIGSLFRWQSTCWRQLLMNLELAGMKQQGFHAFAIFVCIKAQSRTSGVQASSKTGGKPYILIV